MLQAFHKEMFAPHYRFIHTKILVNVVNPTSKNSFIATFFAQVFFTKGAQDSQACSPIEVTFYGIVQKVERRSMPLAAMAAAEVSSSFRFPGGALKSQGGIPSEGV